MFKKGGMTGHVAQAVKHLLSKYEALKLQNHQK
jgi:hypothetical protein